MTELRMPKSGKEFCYRRTGGKVELFDDSTLPRLHIATIIGDDLDGWIWGGETDAMRNAWPQPEPQKTWRKALVEAASEYILQACLRQLNKLQ